MLRLEIDADFYKEGEDPVYRYRQNKPKNGSQKMEPRRFGSAEGIFRFARAPNSILVVDDDVGTCESIRMILEDKYTVITCDKPKKVLEIVASGKADLVLLDLRLPSIDGLELLKAIKTVAQDQSVEIALITGYPSIQSAVKAMEYGAYDYVIKPIDKKRLEEVVQKGIALHNQKDLEKKIMANQVTKIYKSASLNYYTRICRVVKSLLQHSISGFPR